MRPRLAPARLRHSARLLPGLLLLCSVFAPPSFAEEPGRVDLAKHERKVFSQFGEDGVLERLFEIIEPTSRFCVEFGASNGVAASNTRNLIVNHGWASLQIEGDEKFAATLERNFEKYPKAKTLQAWVWPGNIEILFEENGVPKDLDLLVIDIDSNDYYVWRAIHDFRPKVVLVEANVFFPPPQRMVIDYHPMNYWDGSQYIGASLQSFYELAKRKGYELVHVMSWGPNAVFVDAQYFDRFGIEDNSPVAMQSPAMREAAEKLEREGVEPMLGEPFLIWKDLKIEKKWILDR